jgi:hypothetical protein
MGMNGFCWGGVRGIAQFPLGGKGANKGNVIPRDNADWHFFFYSAMVAR